MRVRSKSANDETMRSSLGTKDVGFDEGNYERLVGTDYWTLVAIVAAQRGTGPRRVD